MMAVHSLGIQVIHMVDLSYAYETRISRRRAYSLVQSHGLRIADLLEEFGPDVTYNLGDLLAWLGY